MDRVNVGFAALTMNKDLGLSAAALGSNLFNTSSLQAPNRGTLLAELWYEQAVLDGRITVRAWQLLADQEFTTNAYA